MSAALLTDTVHCPERLATWRIHSRQASSAAPVRWRSRNIDLTRETLLNNWPLICERFGEHEALLDKLLAGVYRYYEEEFCLDRLHLRRRPLVFAKGLLRAAIQNPSFLWRRVKQRLRWEDSIESYTQQLVEELEIPWPPTKLEGEVTAHINRKK
jgi:hypothetical protein